MKNILEMRRKLFSCLLTKKGALCDVPRKNKFTILRRFFFAQIVIINLLFNVFLIMEGKQNNRMKIIAHKINVKENL